MAELLDLELAPAPALDNIQDEPLPLYEPCLCLGVLPGRACMLCMGTQWKKRCPECAGRGLLIKSARCGSQPVTERCLWCNGKGWVGAKPADRAAIQQQVAGVKAVRAAAEKRLQQGPAATASVAAAEILTGAPQRSAKSSGRGKQQKSTAKKSSGRRGRQPSPESLARLAARTGEPAAAAAAAAAVSITTTETLTITTPPEPARETTIVSGLDSPL